MNKRKLNANLRAQILGEAPESVGTKLVNNLNSKFR